MEFTMERILRREMWQRWLEGASVKFLGYPNYEFCDLAFHRLNPNLTPWENLKSIEILSQRFKTL